MRLEGYLTVRNIAATVQLTIVAALLVGAGMLAYAVRPRDGVFNNIDDPVRTHPLAGRASARAHWLAWQKEVGGRPLTRATIEAIAGSAGGSCKAVPQATAFDYVPLFGERLLECSVLVPKRSLQGLTAGFEWIMTFGSRPDATYRLIATNRTWTK